MSDDTAIRVESLGKRYRIAHAVERPASLRKALGGVLSAPFRYLGQTLTEASESEIIWALKDVSFEVRRGEVLGIIGRNGAGKSTLLKILSRITDPSTGRALVRGRVNSLLEVGTGFHPELSGRENIFMNAALHGMRRRDVMSKLDAIIEFSEVGKFIDTPVKRYSSGMYVRLAFAVAAHLDPEVLIVDEVLAVGDAAFQRKCISAMNEVARQGRTVLLVTHTMATVKAFCKRAIFLEGGRLSMDGDVDAVVDRYMGLGGSQQADVEYDATAPHCGTRDILVRRVRVVGEDGSTAPDLFLGQHFGIEITIDVLRDLPHVTPQMRIYTNDGMAVTFSSTRDGGRKQLSIPKGRHVIRADHRTVLLPGEYTVEIGFNDIPSETYGGLDKTVVFSVKNVARTGDDSYPWGRVVGHIRPDVSWVLPDPIRDEAGSPT